MNETGERFDETFGTLEPRSDADWCFEDPGAHRVHLGSTAYAGGFVYVDD